MQTLSVKFLWVQKENWLCFKGRFLFSGQIWDFLLLQHVDKSPWLYFTVCLKFVSLILGIWSIYLSLCYLSP